MSNQILAMMPQSAGYFRVQLSLWKHYTGDLAENHNGSNLNWDFSVRMDRMYLYNVQCTFPQCTCGNCCTTQPNDN